MAFRKLPTWWVREDLLKHFTATGGAGKSIAILKCLLAICAKTDYDNPIAQVSFTELQKLTGLSRPMVSEALADLANAGLIKIGRTTHVHRYKLLNSEDDDRWGKMPVEPVLANISGISNRGGVPLLALKIYILLLAKRPNESSSIAIGYDKLEEDTGGQRKEIRRAVDMLINHSLVHVDKVGTSRSQHNVYRLIGIN